MAERFAVSAWLVLPLLVANACKKESAPSMGAPPTGSVSAVVPSATQPSMAEAAASSAPIPSTAALDAREFFRNRCQVCHGEKGKGDGPGAAALNPKPRNYTNPVWQASVTDDYLAKFIVEGGAAAGKSPGMPANPDLADKPEVLRELVKIVRSFRGK